MILAQSDFSEWMGMAAGFLCPLAFVTLVSYMLGLFVFGPLYAKESWTPPQIRFRIADILVLLVQLQLAAGLLLAVMPQFDPSPLVARVALAVFVWITLIWWWYCGVRMLARARVERGGDRLLFLAIILPVGYLLTLGMMASPVLMVTALFILAWSVHNPDWDEILMIFPIFIGLAVTYGSVFLVRWYCSHIIDHARDDVAVTQGIVFEKLHVCKPVEPIAPPPLDAGEVHIVDETSDK